MDDDIPPLKRHEDMPPIATSRDLHRHWRAFMGPLGFSEHVLWLLFLDADGRVAPTVTQLADLPTFPDPELLHNLLDVVRQILAGMEGASCAFLVSRPGSAYLTESDRAWARGLMESAAHAGVRMHPVHLANDEELRVLAPDDLLPAHSRLT